MTSAVQYASLTDAELVRRCRVGDVDAWNELVERFGRYVYAIATRGFRLGDEDAEDAFQEVFARVYTRLHTLRDEASVRPWIAQLTRRVCLDVIAKRGREHPTPDPVPEGLEHTIDEIEEAFVVRQAVSTLSETCREILDRFFTRDQTYRTISEELDIPSGTIGSRIARCLTKLRAELEGRSEGSSRSRE